ncbi:MAG: Ig-like domain repeat protein [Deltaproteobacteria bacterium]|nr:Ig-like domain repeat protein [Deltaproteobacteria bacterium]
MRWSLRLVVAVGFGLTSCSDDGGQAPDTALDAVPPALSNQKRVEITFHPLGNANSFFCTIDGTTSQCISPFIMELADGAHTFEVAAALNAKVDDTPATHTWLIDTVAPTTTILEGPQALDNSSSPIFTFEGADDRGAITFECSLDGAAFAACTSPSTLQVADGTHEFRVRAKDDAGNVDDTPATHGWTVDTTAPDTAIDAGPAEGSTSAPDGTFAFSSSDPTATFECSVDGEAFAACTSPLAFSLADGSHAFAVRAVDAVGLRDPSPATRGWIVDAIAPDVTVTQGPPNPSNNATPTFMFSSTDPTATFACRIDAGAFAACTSPFTSSALADGNHTFAVRAADPFGNTSAPATHAWAIDTVAPTVTIVTAPPAISNNPAPAVTFTTAGAPATIQCQVDAGAFAACTSPFAPGALPDGTHTITVRVTDAAGNSSQATTSPFTIDTVPPTVTITSQPAALSNVNTPTVAFTTAGAPTTIRCRVDAGALAACTSPFTAAPVADGAHTITIVATDAAGNQGSATTNSFTVDTVAPTVTILSQPAALSNNTTPTVTFSAVGAPTLIQCRVDAGAFANCTTPFTAPPLADGPHTITVRATDGAGNQGSATTNTFTVDTVAPVITFTSQPAPLSNVNPPTLVFTVTGGATTILCRVDIGPQAACTSPFTPAALADGAHTITVVATDGAGNQATATTSSFTIDTVAPTVTITTQPPSLSNNKTPTIIFTTAGAPTIVQCRVDTGAFANCASPFTTSALADGSHTITVRVQDGAGNSSSATTSSFVIDTTPPAIVFDDAPPSVWPVNYFDMFFHATEAAALTCSLNGAAFSPCSTGLGVTVPYNQTSTFVVRATDAAGNVGQGTATWASVDGLVLHYPFERGSTHNTSLLAQNPPYSPDGSLEKLTSVGGWAGTALGNGIPAHRYSTKRVFASAGQPQTYTVSFWVRPVSDGANGTIMSTLGGAGFRVRMQGLSLTTEVLNPQTGALTPRSFTVGLDKWTHVGLLATGTGKPLQIFFNGNFQGVVDSSFNGFEAGQGDLTIGAINNLDLDDVRVFNKALANAEMCTTLTRGFVNGQNQCVPMSPGIELAFEHNRLIDTGLWDIPFTAPVSSAFLPTKLGDGIRVTNSSFWGYTQSPAGAGFRSFANSVPATVGRSFSLWFDPSTPVSNLINFTAACPGNGGTCGIQVVHADANVLRVFTGTGLTFQQTTNIPFTSTGSLVSVVVAESRNAAGGTAAITVYVNGGPPTAIPISGGNIYQSVSDTVTLADREGKIIDEYQFWTTDLSKNPEALCENGFGGEVDHIDGTCALTSN